MFDALAGDDAWTEVFVAEMDGKVAGFVFAILDEPTGRRSGARAGTLRL